MENALYDVLHSWKNYRKEFDRHVKIIITIALEMADRKFGKLYEKP